MRQLLPFVPVATLILAAACSSKDSGGDKTSPTDAGSDTATDADPPIDAGTEDADAAPSGPLSASYVDFSINHIILAGQSNALGNDATTILSSTQSYANLSFDTGVIPLTDCGDEGCATYQTPTGFIPLVEGDSYYYPVEDARLGPREPSVQAREGRLPVRDHPRLSGPARHPRQRHRAEWQHLLVREPRRLQLPGGGPREVLRPAHDGRHECEGPRGDRGS